MGTKKPSEKRNDFVEFMKIAEDSGSAVKSRRSSPLDEVFKKYPTRNVKPLHIAIGMAIFIGVVRKVKISL